MLLESEPTPLAAKCFAGFDGGSKANVGHYKMHLRNHLFCSDFANVWNKRLEAQGRLTVRFLLEIGRKHGCHVLSAWSRQRAESMTWEAMTASSWPGSDVFSAWPPWTTGPFLRFWRIMQQCCSWKRSLQRRCLCHMPLGCISQKCNWRRLAGLCDRPRLSVVVRDVRCGCYLVVDLIRIPCAVYTVYSQGS